jgi:hypothetical protein
MQFENLPLQQGSIAGCAPMQFENLPLQPGSTHVAVRVCMQRDGRITGRRPLVIWTASRRQKFTAGSLVVWTMQYCNGMAVMSALEALDLAGKGLNAFSVLYLF